MGCLDFVSCPDLTGIKPLGVCRRIGSIIYKFDRNINVADSYFYRGYRIIYSHVFETDNELKFNTLFGRDE